MDETLIPYVADELIQEIGVSNGFVALKVGDI